MEDQYYLSPSTLSLNVLPQARPYTKEALRKLQKNMRTLASSSSSLYAGESKSKPDPKPEFFIVLKGLVKCNATVVQTLRQVDKLSSNEEEGEKERRFGEKREGSYRDDAERWLAAIGFARGQDLSRLLFPDQATKNAIRAYREQLRQSQGAALDYTLLEGGCNHGTAEGLSDEELEFQRQIAMFREKTEGGKKGVFESFDDGAVDVLLRKETELEDDEDEIGEEKQFRKGLGKRINDGTTREVSITGNNSTVPA